MGEGTRGAGCFLLELHFTCAKICQKSAWWFAASSCSTGLIVLAGTGRHLSLSCAYGAGACYQHYSHERAVASPETGVFLSVASLKRNPQCESCRRTAPMSCPFEHCDERCVLSAGYVQTDEAWCVSVYQVLLQAMLYSLCVCRHTGLTQSR